MSDRDFELLGVPFTPMDVDAALESVVSLYDRGETALVVHTNAHTLNLARDDPSYRQILRDASLVLNDGKGVMLGARLLGRRLPADLNGNLFSPLLLREAADRGWPVFFYGAKPGVAERAGELLTQRFPGLTIVGCRDGYARDPQEVVEAIRASGAGLVMVALGNPLQEKWLADHLGDTGARVGVGVGAFFDFQAGGVPRAPAGLNRVGLEWLYRLIKEPRRMWRRYVLGNPRFILAVLHQRFGRG